MNFHLITSDIYFFSLGKRPLVFLIGPSSGECTAIHLKNFQWGGHISFFKSYSQKTKKVTYFPSNFFVFILTSFTNHVIPTPDFFTTFSHSYSLHHGTVVLFLFHLPSELVIFFNFCQKMTKNFFPKFTYFFLRINATVGVTTPTAELKVLSHSFQNFFIK